MNRKQEFLNLFNIIATPTEVYRALHDSPRWRMPLALLALSSLALGWFMIPAVSEPMRKIFASSFGDDAAAVALHGIMKTIIIAQLVAEPLFITIRWLVMAVGLYLLSRLYKRSSNPRFSEMFSAVAYTESIFVLMNVLTTLMIYLRGLEAIELPGDLRIFRGLDYFLPGGDSIPALTTILSNVNPFSAWYTISMAIGLGALTGIRTREAILIAGVSWMIWVAVTVVQPQAANLLVSWLA